ncbi:MAG: dihydroorotate dehydrogenase (quinone) [Gammaproteobacteria bacterium]|nr:dihydroorotate dehydrogenase (quinone) [Gammaproteobacteria bacterium]
MLRKLKIYNLARKLLFLLPPEQSQNISHFFLKLFSGLYKSKQTRFSVKGLKIKNRLGLAAGLDKNARLINEFDNIGFGFVEVGTITPKAQYGNRKPRIKRLVSDESLLNSLGFPNEGVATIKPRLKKVRDDICLGVNIGPNKDTVPEEIKNDYLTCYREIFEYADFVTINISSPNTPNLRSLHNIDSFKSVIEVILNERKKHLIQPKIFIKISPDEESTVYKDLIETINDSAIDGIIISNTSNNQNLKESLKVGHLPGGISGKSLKNSANEILKEIKTIINEEKIIVAVGGVFDVDSYNEKFELGADLVQMYTGLIYEGPNLVKRIVKNDKQISSNS